MSKYYFTFGQVHAHSVNGKTFDKDCVVEIEAEHSEDARATMFEHFGAKWHRRFDSPPDMSYYPRGVIAL